VPVGIMGDNYDRYYVRMREMDESVYMIRQLMDMMPEGPINVDDRRCVFPEKHLVYTEIESLIPLTGDGGPAVPAGDIYLAKRPTETRVLHREHRRTRCTCVRQASCTWVASTKCSTATSWPISSPRSDRST
jgi:hypothetical protein